jgi:hypothetical protein
MKRWVFILTLAVALTPGLSDSCSLSVAYPLLATYCSNQSVSYTVLPDRNTTTYVENITGVSTFSGQEYSSLALENEKGLLSIAYDGGVIR